MRNKKIVVQNGKEDWRKKRKGRGKPCRERGMKTSGEVNLAIGSRENERLSWCKANKKKEGKKWKQGGN